MKNIITTIALLITAVISAAAQAPQGFSYQAVVRDAQNAVVADETFEVSFSILQGGADGNSVYSETYEVTTNANGLFTITIGKRYPDVFAAIDWSAGNYYLKTESEYGTSTSQLLSVPYAMYAAKTDLSGLYSKDEIDAKVAELQTQVERLKYERTYTVKGVSFKMKYVQGGTFTMGSSDSDEDAYDNEKPAHSVTLSSFGIGETEVTQELWAAVMGKTITEIIDENSYSAKGIGDKYPMYYVSWDDCQTFISKLNELTGQTFRLPTEAEWEYAARGGNKSQSYKYSGSNAIGDVAWYGDNSNSTTHAVATKAPNELGIYDMTGNVWEWCQDWWGGYAGTAQTDPQGPDTGSRRVDRGGSWVSLAGFCRVAYRIRDYPDRSYYDLGLRLACSF